MVACNGEAEAARSLLLLLRPARDLYLPLLATPPEPPRASRPAAPAGEPPSTSTAHPTGIHVLLLGEAPLSSGSAVKAATDPTCENQRGGRLCLAATIASLPPSSLAWTTSASPGCPAAAVGCCSPPPVTDDEAS